MNKTTPYKIWSILPYTTGGSQQAVDLNACMNVSERGSFHTKKICYLFPLLLSASTLLPCLLEALFLRD